MHGFGSQAGAAFDVVGGFRPWLAECVAERVDAVLVMALAFPDSVASGSQCNHAELERGFVGELDAAVGTQSGSLGIGKAAVCDLQQTLDFGDGGVILLKPAVPQPLL
jgi:hypothetical protein